MNLRLNKQANTVFQIWKFPIIRSWLCTAYGSNLFNVPKIPSLCSLEPTNSSPKSSALRASVLSLWTCSYNKWFILVWPVVDLKAVLILLVLFKGLDERLLVEFVAGWTRISLAICTTSWYRYGYSTTWSAKAGIVGEKIGGKFSRSIVSWHRRSSDIRSAPYTCNSVTARNSSSYASGHMERLHLVLKYVQ